MSALKLTVCELTGKKAFIPVDVVVFIIMVLGCLALSQISQISKSIPGIGYLSYPIFDFSEQYELSWALALPGQGKEGIDFWVCNRTVGKAPDPEGTCSKCAQN